jgi:hypothetical protein
MLLLKESIFAVSEVLFLLAVFLPVYAWASNASSEAGCVGCVLESFRHAARTYSRVDVPLAIIVIAFSIIFVPLIWRASDNPQIVAAFPGR